MNCMHMYITIYWRQIIATRDEPEEYTGKAQCQMACTGMGKSYKANWDLDLK